ncbi:MAG: hypothetical protein ND807_13180, partial [Vicinamibacterales bacterium]|nr:hypothetical protein [Vicinamibacterales bacterium]
MNRRCSLLLALLALAVPLVRGQAGGPIDQLRQSFLSPPPDSRIMMRWWWFGPTVTHAQLERELRLMREGGIGGVEIQPVYPVVLDDAARGISTLPFLSDGFIGALRFAGDKARELGLRVDLTVGSGWPYGGPQVSIDHAAGKLRVERVMVPASLRVAVPSIGAGEKLLAVFLAPATELTDIGNGFVVLPAGAVGREVLFFISSRSGMMVKRPAVGAEGYVLNHFDRNALDQYLKTVGDRLLEAFPADRPYAVFADSLEVYESDWTADFLEEFKTRRGYDLKPHLPALVTDSAPNAATLRHDWGQTLTELLTERFVEPMQEWARRNRTRFRFQGYGTPPAALSSNAHVDLPEGEGAQWKALSSTRWASSVSHAYGRPVTSSETWTWLHSPVFRASPLDLKAEADLHFLQGVNQLIGHGWPYTAEGVEYPGWRFYAAAVFNDKNPWWLVMPDVSLYLQRISFLMRQGTPVNDVAIYLPTDDAWAHFAPGRVNMIETLRERIGPAVVSKVLEAGFGFDFVDDEALRASSAMHRVVIVPGVERMPSETLRALETFARAGGVVIATRRLPESAPSGLFEGPGAPAHFVRDEADLGSTLGRLMKSDVELSAGAADIGFVHRHTDAADIYFLANTANTPRSVDATFRLPATNGESWDPIRGTVAPLDVREAPAGRTAVTLDFEPYGSRVLVFSTQKRSGRASAARRIPARPPVAPTSVDLSTGWTVSFGADGPPVAFDSLRSWTDNPATRYFSGLATYAKNIEVPAAMLRSLRRVRIEFGNGTPVPPQPLRNGMQAWLDAPVREAAVVYVNDRRVGSVWCPPYSLDVTDFVRPGANSLRIVVANLAINHMAGQALPSYRLLNLRYGSRFDPQDM